MKRLHPSPIKTIQALAIAFLLAAPGWQAQARNVEYLLPIDEVLRMPAAQRELDGSVRFYMYGQDHTETVYVHQQEVVRGNVRGAGEEEVESCKRAALKVLVHYQEKARKMGANAVIDLMSFFKQRPYMSRSQYECHAGSTTVVVILKGTYAKIAY